MTDIDRAATRRRSALWWLVVLLVTFGGLVLRTWNLDFDQRQHLHPDERHWSLTAASLQAAPAPPRHGTVAGPVLDWLDGQRSPANAYRGGGDTFVYGPATLAASRGVAGWLHDGVVSGSQPAALVADGLEAVGIPLTDSQGMPRFNDGYEVDLIGRLLGALADAATIVVVALIGRRVGGRGAGLAAAVLAASSVIGIQLAHFLGSEPVLVLTAALTVLACLHIDRGPRAGPAMRTAFVAGLAVGAMLAAKFSGVGLALVPVLGCGWLAVTRRGKTDWIRLGAVVLGLCVAFRVLYPSAFDGLGLGISDQFWTDIRNNRESVGLDLPPAMQWSSRAPVVEALRWLFLFSVGPGAFIAAVGGAILLVLRRASVGRWNVAVLVAAWLIPMALVLRQSITTGRYFVPMLPALYVCGGFGIAALVRLARHGRPARPLLAGAAAAVLVGSAALWALAFVSGVYGQDHTRIQATRWITENVEPGSVLSVEAWDDALPLPLTGSEPSTYELEELNLFGPDSPDKTEVLADQLTEIDYVVESSPRVSLSVTRIPARFPSTIEFFEGLDSGALGFERVATFTNPARLGWWKLDDSSMEEAYSVYDHPEVRIWKRVRDLSNEELLARLDPVAAATALAVHPDDGHANGAMLHESERAENAKIGTFDDLFDSDGHPLVHALGWLVLLELLGLAAFAVFVRALHSLPDAGAGLAKTLGMTSTAFGIFLAATWGGLPLTRSLVAGCTATWLGIGASLAYRRRELLRDLWRTRRRTLMQVEVITVVAFGLLLLLRAANPDLWHIFRGGEKPFEMEMLTAVLRTRTLPPYDPWYSGGVLNYYYFGYMVLSVPARVLATSPALAMNLAVATVASLASGAVYSTAAAIAGLVRQNREAPGPMTDATSRVARRAGLVAVLFVLVLPNAAIVPSIIDRILGTERGQLDWWALSRTLPGQPVVTEFPAWSLLFGDVHPHLLDLPILATILAVAIAWYRTLVGRGSWRSPFLLAVLAGVLLGTIRATNTWDLPLALGATALAPIAALVARAPWRRCVGAGLVAIGCLIVAWAPYWWRSEVADAGVELEDLHTPLSSWLAHFGFFALCAVVVVALTLARRPTANTRRAALAIPIAAVLCGGLAVLVPGRAALSGSIFLVAALAAAAFVAYKEAPERPAGAPALAVVAAGWTIVAAIELVSVVNDFDRMNTVFKGWFQAWLLLALGTAVAIAGLAAPTHRLFVRMSGLEPRARAVAIVARTQLILAVLMATAFVQLAVPARLSDRTSPDGWSLDGLAFLDGNLTVGYGADEYAPVDDRALITWLQANVAGLPTIAEAPGDAYTWSGRVGAHTGLPTVIGWPYHQTQQRRAYESTVNARISDMTDLYTSGDPIAITAVLQRYSVDYVVFGTTEQALASPASAQVLLESPCLTVVFEEGDSFIAEVGQECLAGEAGGLPIAPTEGQGADSGS